MANAATRKDELIISALLGYPTVKAAATACGVCETQIYARLRDPAFKERYKAARYAMLDQCTAYVQGLVADALYKMYEIMTNPDNAPTVQLQAATAITRTQQAMTEQIDILAELDELKKAVFHEQ